MCLLRRTLPFINTAPPMPVPSVHHYDIRLALCRTCVAFAQQGHARIVFDHEGKAQLAPAPLRKVDARGIIILLIGRNHATRRRICEAAETQYKCAGLGTIYPGVRRHAVTWRPPEGEARQRAR